LLTRIFIWNLAAAIVTMIITKFNVNSMTHQPSCDYPLNKMA